VSLNMLNYIEHHEHVARMALCVKTGSCLARQSPRARNRARENFNTLRTLRIDTPGNVAITPPTSPVS
jgi:hypothetical protein